jgi:glutathione S-transferase
VILLYQPPTRPWGMPNMSPFCIKLESYLRMAKVPFEARAAEMQKAPKGKIPYVSIDGQLMGDSQLVIEHLEKKNGAPLDGWLDDAQRATGHAVRRMFDEGYYFVGIYNRWVSDDGWALMEPEFKKLLPGPLKVITGLIRKRVRKQIHLQGTGRHSHDEIMAIGKADFAALSSLLGDRAFLFGDRPSTFDCSAFGFLEATLGFPLESEVRRFALGQTNLVRYRDRIKTAYFA